MSAETDPTVAAKDFVVPRLLDDADGKLRKHAIKAALIGDDGPSQQIGRYQVQRRLGQGGMAVVYAARDETLERTVALKLLTRGTDLDESTERRRLLREATALARLQHRAVATVHEVDVHDGHTYLAMEYVDGQTLGQWLEERPRPWREVVGAFIEAGEGLAAAHASDIIHRDFKPANVMVAKDGRIVVLDFGLARSARVDAVEDPEALEALIAPAQDSSELSFDLTMTGTLLGTPGYMSPEQFLGVETTAASDQFSFCVALFEALHGERPFPARSIAELARAVTLDPRPSLRSGVPRRLRRAVRRGLAASPEERWPSMPALLDELRRVIRPRRPLVMVAGGALVAAASLGAAAWYADHVDAQAEEQFAAQDREVRDATRMQAVSSLADSDPTAALALVREVEDPAGTKQWSETALGLLQRPYCQVVRRDHGEAWPWTTSVSPSGTHVLTGSRDGSVHLSRMDGHGKAWAAHDVDAVAAAFSPDGRMIASAGTAVRAWTFDGSPDPAEAVTFRSLSALMTSGSTPGIAVSNDGLIVNGSNDGTVYLWRVPDSDREPGPPQILAAHDKAAWSVSLSPDRRTLATASIDGTAKIWSLDSAEPTELATLRHDGPIWTIRFSPDGEQLLTATSDHHATLWSASTGEPLAEWSHDGPLLNADFSPDGRRVATGGEQGTVQLWSTERPDEPAVVLRGHAANVNDVEFSPDGGRLLSTSQDATARVWAVPDRGASVDAPVVFQIGEPVFFGRFSPDGERIVLSSENSVTRVCHVQRPASRTTVELPNTLRSMAASADGSMLVGTTSRGLVQLSGSNISTIDAETPWEHHTIDLTPDGTWAAAREPSGPIRVWQTRGTRVHRAPTELERVRAIALAPDATLLAAADDRGELQVWSISASGLEPRARLSGRGASIETLTFTKRGALVAGDREGRLLHWSDLDDDPALLDTGRDALLLVVADLVRNRVAALDEAGTTRVWEVTDDGRFTATANLKADPARPRTLAFVDGGEALLGAAADGRVLRWRDHSPEAWQPVASLPAGGDLGSMVIVANGQRVVGGGVANRLVHRWETADFETDPQTLQRRLWAATTECLSVAHRRELLGQDEDTAQAALEACRAEY
ncbi:MAG: protein kinase [Myxococcota bacterium]